MFCETERDSNTGSCVKVLWTTKEYQDLSRCVTVQPGSSVTYASRALTSAKSRYAQIEKELLASMYACERFHQYVYGQAFEVETDHKSLVSIMSKPLNDCPVRIQRMLIRLQKYDVHMIYTQGKYMYTTDTLSTALDKEECADSEKSAEIQAYVDTIVMCRRNTERDKYR